jgi:hypothetical protein
MGFSKCYLTKDKIISTYKNNQLFGVEKLLMMYDIYVCDEISSEIIDIYNKNKLTDEVLNIYLYEKVNNTESV